jgi:hypothetical protein
VYPPHQCAEVVPPTRSAAVKINAFNIIPPFEIPLTVYFSEPGRSFKKKNKKRILFKRK